MASEESVDVRFRPGPASTNGTFVVDDGDDSDEDHDHSNSKHGGGACEGYQQVRSQVNKETFLVKLGKSSVILSILIAGAIVSTLTYVTLNGATEEDADSAFILFSQTIEDSFRFNVHEVFEASRSLGRAVTTAAMTAEPEGEDFPFVTVPAFEARAYEARLKGRFEILVYAPVATNMQQWIDFSTSNIGWYQESKEMFDQLEPGQNRSAEAALTSIPPVVYRLNNDGLGEPWKDNRLFCPSMHTSPPPLKSAKAIMNVDFFSNQEILDLSLASEKLKDAVFSPLKSEIGFLNDLTGADIDRGVDAVAHPQSISANPVFQGLSNDQLFAVGYIFSIISWDKYFNNLLPQGVNGMVAVLKSSCGDSISYLLEGEKSIFIGWGDIHEEKYTESKKTIHFQDNYIDPAMANKTKGHCFMFLDVYSSSEFENSYKSNLPWVFALVIAVLFFCMALVFLFYNRCVDIRNQKVLSAAARSTAIIRSLFPQNVHERLFSAQAVSKAKNIGSNNNSAKGGVANTPDGPVSLRGFFDNGAAGEDQNHNDMDEDDSDLFKSKPIADLFPETTIMFADIAGFTAWSSVREPSQVFTLLETLYHAFDEIAKRRRVFKVETIGDCYVAVCGLPDPRKDHAVNMVRFAKDCMFKAWALTQKLEVKLGPDTGDLSLRVGLHSGPVTAGVLRGERSRFQLFGDTMNTASRMESTGKKNCIQISNQTADLLIQSGKSKWITPREDKVIAKGKGEMTTWFVDLSASGRRSSELNGSVGSELSQSEGDGEPVKEPDHVAINGKTKRLIDWNVEVLLRLLRQIEAVRQVPGIKNSGTKKPNETLLQPLVDKTVFDEVKEVISLKRGTKTGSINVDEVKLSPSVCTQLRDYVENIALLYRNNSFHNFEHASHVTMSVVKLLSRIVAPSENELASSGASSLHDHTYGITSDPIIQFACVLSALIHDVDHYGVPNAQLIKERAPIAAAYNDLSVAEQNSLDIAFELLLEEKYNDLRAAIYSDEAEMLRFRSLVVNSVMATDIVDKELKSLRNARWEKAFSESASGDEDGKVATDRKATIVIEHLIQASDVSHTMQHWHIYRKWNELFFLECYRAYRQGRAERDPSTFWYRGEIGFFDFYIIPLAKKLKNCGVFGVSSDEYLNYAEKNRQEWEARGEEVVAELVEKAKFLEGHNFDDKALRRDSVF